MRKIIILCCIIIIGLLQSNSNAAMINYEIVRLKTTLLNNEDATVYCLRWTNVHQTDTCQKYFGIGNYTLKTIQVNGTWGGATVNIEGSNDDENYFPISDTSGNAIIFVSDGIKISIDTPIYLRWTVTGGDETTNLQILIKPTNINILK